VAILVTLDDAEHALLGDHLRAVSSGHRSALLGRHLIDALLLCPPRAQSADLVRDLPDAVLVGYQNVIVTPGKPVRFVEVLNVALDPGRMSGAINAAQQCEIAHALLRHQHVSVGKHQKAARIDKTRHKQGRRKAGRNLRDLSRVGKRQGSIGDDGPRLWRGQIAGIDLVASTDLMLGQKILLERLSIIARSLRGCNQWNHKRCHRGGEEREAPRHRGDVLF